MRTQRWGTASAPRLLAGVGLVLGLLAIVTLASLPSAGLGQSPGLVAAYSFDEGAGASVADASGSGNVGAIGSATWTSLGRFGNALAFNGQSRVTVPDAPSLRLQGAMTLSAWVFPSAWAAGEMSSTRGTTTTTCRLLVARVAPGRRSHLRRQLGRGVRHRPLALEHVDASGDDLRRADPTPVRERRPGREPPADRGAHAVHEPARDRRRLPLRAALRRPHRRSPRLRHRPHPDPSPSGHEHRHRRRSAPDTQPPTAPTGLAATATSPTQINLSWTAATDNAAILQYRVERCQGAGCSNFAEIATATGTTYQDTGRTPSTSYSYRVRAQDTSTNLGPYSNTATATRPRRPISPRPRRPT